VPVRSVVMVLVGEPAVPVRERAVHIFMVPLTRPKRR
jgi:hypothetical protein